MSARIPFHGMTPFESGIRFPRQDAWRHYRAFLLAYPGMIAAAEADTWACLVRQGVVCA